MNTIDTILSRYAAWNVLRWFLRHPTEEIHVNHLARELGVSSGTASRLLRELHAAGVLTRNKRANVVFYSLDNENLTAKQLKVLDTSVEIDRSSLVNRFLDVDDSIITLALFGSYATGENDERSDLDLLVVTGSRGKSFENAAAPLGRALGAQSGIVVFSPTSWNRLKEKDPAFYWSVMSSHVPLFGSRLS